MVTHDATQPPLVKSMCRMDCQWQSLLPRTQDRWWWPGTVPPKKYPPANKCFSRKTYCAPQCNLLEAGTLVPQQAVHHRLTAATYTLQMLATRAPKPSARHMPSSEDAALHKPITPLRTCRHHSQDPSNTSEVRMCGDIAKMVTRTAFKRSKC